MTTDHTSPFPPPSAPASGTGTRLPVGRRRLLALAAGASLLTGGIVAAGAGSASAIVDGEPTTAGDNPWQVALTSDGEQFCGGSIVSDRVIVTAAHCTVGTDPADIQIRAGVEDLTTDDGQTIQVAQVIEHPTYGGGSADIAMLVLEQPIRFDATAAAIPLATADETAAATTGRVTGWGVLDENSEGTPDVMQTADVPTVGDQACDSALDGIDGPNELCAGGTGTDSCYGDSGGPLTIETDRGRVLAGVTSWGLECGGETPGVYAEVSTFADWIAERVADPDAPAPERPDVDEFGDDFGDVDELPDGIEVDDDGFVEIPDAFFDQYGDELDELDDEEFWELFVEWSADQGDGEPIDDASMDHESNGDGDAPTGDDLEFDHDAIDALDEDRFEEFLDGLSDDEFDRYVAELDALWADELDGLDAADFDESDFGDADFGESDDEFEDGGLDPMDHAEYEDGLDDDTAFDVDDLADFDTNGDGDVQWDELNELFVLD